MTRMTGRWLFLLVWLVCSLLGDGGVAVMGFTLPSITRGRGSLDTYSVTPLPAQAQTQTQERATPKWPGYEYADSVRPTTTSTSSASSNHHAINSYSYKSVVL